MLIHRTRTPQIKPDVASLEPKPKEVTRAPDQRRSNGDARYRLSQREQRWGELAVWQLRGTVAGSTDPSGSGIAIPHRRPLVPRDGHEVLRVERPVARPDDPRVDWLWFIPQLWYKRKIPTWRRRNTDKIYNWCVSFGTQKVETEGESRSEDIEINPKADSHPGTNQS
jgi:hypothetical protein